MLCDMVNDFALQQLVMEPTRNDNIQSFNSPEKIVNVQVVDGIMGSDHHTVQINITRSRPSFSQAPVMCYHFKKANFDLFRDLLSKIPWNCCYLTDSVDHA